MQKPPISYLSFAVKYCVNMNLQLKRSLDLACEPVKHKDFKAMYQIK